VSSGALSTPGLERDYYELRLKKMRSFTRGTFLLMAAQGVLMLSGYALNVFLARYFGPEQYGVYGVAMAVLVWVELFVINGVPTAMQKFLAESPERAATWLRLGRRMQFGYALSIFIIFMLSAPLISASLGDSAFKKILWIAAPDILLYGLYWFYLGAHSGLHRFESQALVIASYGISKVTCCVGLILLGAGLEGAIIGNFFGSTVGLIIGAFLLHRTQLPETTTTEHYSSLIKFAVPIVLYTLSNNALLYIDLIFVKKFMPAIAAGHYTAATTIARVPYFIFLGLTATVLPALSRLLTQSDLEASRGLLRQTMRLLLGLLVPVLILVLTNAAEIVELLYTATYAPATPILRWLILGIAMYTLLVVLSTIMSADGFANRAFQINLFAAVSDVLFCLALVPKYGTQGAALATLLAATTGTFVAGIFVLKRFGSILLWRSLLRAALAGMAIAVLALWWKSTGAMLLIELVTLAGLYFLVLYILGELKNPS
jgi:O-antigen/teichoic acid export membrane protein